ncbi:MAG: preprotein translocase subunit Sec61beta [Thermoproteota archaeon]|nr:preprotein translocase subunit Sec61beta [Candidatus Brockarchaeota archaeon]
MSKKRSKRDRRGTRLPAGTAGLLSTLGEKGKGFQIKPIVIVILSAALIVGSILILLLKI